MSRPDDLHVILFDLDGTLIDSIELILRSFEYTLAVHNKGAMDRAIWAATIGTPLQTQLATIAENEAELESLLRTYRTWNLEHHDEFVAAFPGVPEAVQALAQQGSRLGVVTSKSRFSAQKGVELCGYRDAFEILIGSEDSERHKPDPLPLHVALERLECSPDHACYVGDSTFDMLAGRAAGVYTVGVDWGISSAPELLAAGAHCVLSEATALASIVRA